MSDTCIGLCFGFVIILLWLTDTIITEFLKLSPRKKAKFNLVSTTVYPKGCLSLKNWFILKQILSVLLVMLAHFGSISSLLHFGVLGVLLGFYVYSTIRHYKVNGRLFNKYSPVKVLNYDIPFVNSGNTLQLYFIFFTYLIYVISYYI